MTTFFKAGVSAATSAALTSERSSPDQRKTALGFGRLKTEPVPRHYLKRLAHCLADRAALRRAELRARTYGVIAADRLSRGGAL